MKGQFPIILKGILYLSLGLGLVFGAMSSRAQDRMELHLVLAFDVSASVNDEEFDLQRRGTAAAIRSDAVATAIADAPGGVAIAIVQWSSQTQQAIGLDWVALRSAADAAAYADRVEDLPRRLPGGGTMIHAGLDFAAEMFGTAPGAARRRVIDLAANGQTDDTDALLEMRDRLLQRGIAINGLAIEEDDRTLTAYFHREVIGGPGAFVVTADDFPDFGKAMQIKLYREISGAVFSGPVPDGTTPVLARR